MRGLENNQFEYCAERFERCAEFSLVVNLCKARKDKEPKKKKGK